MTFSETVDCAWVVTPIVLTVVFLLPKGRGVIISVYDAGMFAVYLIVLGGAF